MAAMTAGQGEPHCARRLAASSGSPVRMQNRLPARRKAEIEQKLLAMLHVDGFVVCPEQGQRICDGEDDACLGQPENDRASLAENKRSKLLMEPQSQRGFRRARDHAIRSARRSSPPAPARRGIPRARPGRPRQTCRSRRRASRSPRPRCVQAPMEADAASTARRSSRGGRSAQQARRSASVIAIQRATSSPLRPHPRHQPVTWSSVQTPTQGECCSGAVCRSMLSTASNLVPAGSQGDPKETRLVRAQYPRAGRRQNLKVTAASKISPSNLFRASNSL